MAPLPTPPKSVGVLIFPGFEALDAFGALDALNLLSLVHPMTLHTVSATLDPVSTRIDGPDVNQAGSHFAQSIVPTHTVESCPKLDMLLLPGGFGLRAPRSELQPYYDFVRTRYPELRWLFTVCTGSKLAAEAGVLDGKHATSNKMGWKWVLDACPNVKWDPTKRWVRDDADDGKAWTTSGVSAGLDGIMAWIAEVFGEEEATRIANTMEYVRCKDENDEPFAKLYGLV